MARRRRKHSVSIGRPAWLRSQSGGYAATKATRRRRKHAARAVPAMFGGRTAARLARRNVGRLLFDLAGHGPDLGALRRKRGRR